MKRYTWRLSVKEKVMPLWKEDSSGQGQTNTVWRGTRGGWHPRYRMGERSGRDQKEAGFQSRGLYSLKGMLLFTPFWESSAVTQAWHSLDKPLWLVGHDLPYQLKASEWQVAMVRSNLILMCFELRLLSKRTWSLGERHHQRVLDVLALNKHTVIFKWTR